MPQHELFARRIHCFKSTCVTAILLTIHCAVVLPARAATLSWSGGGANANWNNSANWGFAGTPASGDTLVFPAAQPNLLNTNNIAGLTLNQIRFAGASGGYDIRGNSFTLTNSILATNTAGANIIENVISLAMTDVMVNVSGGSTLTFQGNLAGSVGLTKTGTGTLRYSGFQNTYSGTTRVNAGTLELNDSAFDLSFGGDLIIGDGTGTGSPVVRLILSSEIPDGAEVTVNLGGLLDLNNVGDAIGSLTLSGGAVTSGSATLTLNGNVTNLASGSTISGNLSLGGATRILQMTASGLTISAVISDGVTPGAGINQTGGGQFTLSGANTYTGPTTLNGFAILANDSALGANGFSTNGTVCNGNVHLLVSGVNIGNEFLTLASTDDFRSSGTASWAGPITLNGDVDINVFGGTFTNSGVISGSGGITKGQSGTLILTGPSANTFTGGGHVNTGVLELAKPAFVYAMLGLLVVGDGVGGVGTDVVRYRASSQVDSVQVNSSGLLDLNGFSETLGGLTLIGGGWVQTGAGTLSLSGAVDVGPGASPLTNSLIFGKVSLFAGTRTFTVTNGLYSPDFQIDAQVSGSGGITTAGDGELSLNASNSYTSLTVVSAGLLDVDDSFALGTTAAGTVVSNGASLVVRFNAHVGAEALTLNGIGPFSIGALDGRFGSNSWAGPITLASDSTVTVSSGDTLNLTGAIGGSGGLTKANTGTLIYSGGSANNYAGVTTVNAGTLLLAKSIDNSSMTNNLVIGDGIGGVNADVVRLQTTSQLANSTTAVTVNSSGLFDLNNISEIVGSLSGSGNVTLGSPVIVLNAGSDNSSTVFSGVISEPGGFTKSGSGTMTLSGNNTYTSQTVINGGKLLVNGFQPQSHVTVSAVGILGGSGTVGNINNTLGGAVSPGSSPGSLTSSNVVFSGASSDFTVELTGPLAGTDNDQLNIRGTNNLGGATLNVAPAFSGFNAPASGQKFTIINNDGAEAITGTFAGLADNAIFTVGGMQFRVDYDGGTGNDVVLSFTNSAVTQTVGTTVSLGNGNGAVDPNECNYLNLVITNTAADATTNISATLYSETPGVTVTQPFSGYPDIPISGKRTNSSPFQITTAPTFICGTNIQLRLVVQTGNHGTFAVPVVVNSGSAGAPVSFVNNIATAIPDLGAANRLFAVSAISAPVARVEISFQISHTSDADLDIFLIGPDGTRVELTTDNGGTFDDYGLDCTEANRTRFSDLGATSITAGTAPFVGTFRPEGSLAAFIGKNGTDVNGTWTLEVNDDSAGGLGTINCATLFVYPAVCTVGSGVCELCPDVTVTSATGPASPTQSDYVNFTGIPSACGVPKVCPGTVAGGPFPSDNYTFRNGRSNACVTITLENSSPTVNMLVTVYTNSFNPANPDKCVNYLADGGNVVSVSNPTQAFSFNVAANANFVVNVIASTTGTTAPYRLTVSGGDCRPALNVTALPGNKALLDWTTASAGYGLESTNALVTGGSPIWPPIATVPVVINSRFNVTNNVTTSNQFYHLRKPLP